METLRPESAARRAVPQHGISRPSRGVRERGFSLMEAMVATVIAVLAVVGLAYTFGLGRAFINRYEIARMADAVAQARIEALGVLAQSRPASDSLVAGRSYPATPNDFYYHGTLLGQERWRVYPAPAAAPATIQGRVTTVTAVVTWTTGGVADSVTYSRVIGLP